MTPQERLTRIAQLLTEPDGWLVIKQADAQVIAAPLPLSDAPTEPTR